MIGGHNYDKEILSEAYGESGSVTASGTHLDGKPRHASNAARSSKERLGNAGHLLRAAIKTTLTSPVTCRMRV